MIVDEKGETNDNSETGKKLTESFTKVNVANKEKDSNNIPTDTDDNKTQNITETKEEKSDSDKSTSVISKEMELETTAIENNSDVTTDKGSETDTCFSHTRSHQNINETKEERNDSGKSSNAISDEMVVETTVDENNSDMTTDKGSETATCYSPTTAGSTDKPKRRRRRRAKSSVPESVPSTQNEGIELGMIPDKIANIRELAIARIAEIEGKKAPSFHTYDNIMNSESDAIDIHLTFGKKRNKYVIDEQKINYHSEKGNRKVTYKVGGKNDQDSFKDSQVILSVKERQDDSSIRPVIFMADKTTQTNPLLEPPSNCKASDVQNGITHCLDSDGFVKIETVTNPLLEPLSISNVIDIKNSATLNLDSDGSVNIDSTQTNSGIAVKIEASESASHHVEATDLETISEDIKVSKKITSSSLNCPEDSIKNITEDFIKTMNFSKEKFADSLSNISKI